MKINIKHYASLKGDRSPMQKLSNRHLSNTNKVFSSRSTQIGKYPQDIIPLNDTLNMTTKLLHDKLFHSNHVNGFPIRITKRNLLLPKKVLLSMISSKKRHESQRRHKYHKKVWSTGLTICNPFSTVRKEVLKPIVYRTNNNTINITLNSVKFHECTGSRKSVNIMLPNADLHRNNRANSNGIKTAVGACRKHLL